ncbi:MAG: DUF1643 domain-containing protein [Sulfuricurvum sp.]|nr:DUF1643 domain-containing protein [Sulfuricurvum sp.]MDP3022654.1 DUF1643 domain-containing protein [Sulfuricurvum sp.]MDP3120942.1 DUF1643 domain-containing protein [Sulfuricurvum sp.]
MKPQPHIGRQVSHFHQVNIDGIEAVFSDDMKYRYRLSIPFGDEPSRTKTLTVILKNPSSADAMKADKTVQNVEKVVYKAFADVRKIEVLNLFALRGTYPKDVMEAYIAGIDIIGKENDTAFKQALMSSDYIVIAWGGASPIRNSLYDLRVDKVLTMINVPDFSGKVYRKIEKGSDKYPFHACYWPDNIDFNVC